MSETVKTSQSYTDSDTDFSTTQKATLRQIIREELETFKKSFIKIGEGD